MKKKSLLFILFTFILASVFAQSIPQGMNYQAVARDKDGQILADQQIFLKISLISHPGNSPTIHYTEIQRVVTNKFGLFTLVIGKGSELNGHYSSVPWSSEEIWMDVAIKMNLNDDYIALATTQLLAVPYAYYAGSAGTAGTVSTGNGNYDSNGNPTIQSGPSPGQPWATVGNVGNNASTNYLGNSDSIDLVVKTHNLERMRILANGNITFNKSLTIGNALTTDGSVVIDSNLTVWRNVFLNTNPLGVGSTINNGAFTVANNSRTLLTGNLTVNGLDSITNSTQSTSTTTGALTVVGGVGIGKQLNVGGITAIVNTTGSTNPTTGALTVAGGEGVAGNLNVGGNLNVTQLATFNNSTNSTSTSNGSVVVVGGVGIEQNLNVGGTVSFGGASSFGGKLAITDATQSTNTTTGALTVVGGTGIGKNLNVGGIAQMQNNASSTSTNTGALVVTGGTGIGENLNVGGVANMLNNTSSTSTSTGALVVTGGTGIGENLNVGGITKLQNSASSTSATTGALVVTGGTGIGGNVNVGGTTTIAGLTTVNNRLNVTSNVADGQYLATFTNTDSLKGDGIKIKLGRAKSSFSPPALSSPIDSATAAQMKNLIRCDYSGNRLDLLGNIVLTATEEDAEAIAGMAVGVGNIIIGQINSLLSLPIQIGPYSTPTEHIWNSTTIFGGLDLGVLGSIPSLTIPALDIPSLSVIPQTTVMPLIPTIDLTGIGVPAINIADLSFWGIPSDLCLDDASSSPMNNDNEFIRFTDKNDSKMGAIRAVSVTNWSTNYLNPEFMYTLYGALTSSKLDKFHAQYHFKQELIGALKDYASMGVEYQSGNGDYAEWLERADATELINAGDIVAVSGGKITKNLERAEQVMVVSHNPIVLGNVPPEGKNYMGNNIAFMGQVPVKILGPVTSGDYIVGQSNTPGYGLAKHADDMTTEDFKFAVGRSWDNDATDGPKMVNTVVGVHNGDYIKVLKKLESKANDSQIRLQKLEAKVDNLMKVKSSANAGK